MGRGSAPCVVRGHCILGALAAWQELERRCDAQGRARIESHRAVPDDSPSDLYGNFAGAAGYRGRLRRSARPAGVSYRLAIFLHKGAARRIFSHTGIRPGVRGTPSPYGDVLAPFLLAVVL